MGITAAVNNDKNIFFLECFVEAIKRTGNKQIPMDLTVIVIPTQTADTRIRRLLGDDFSRAIKDRKTRVMYRNSLIMKLA